MKKKYFITIDFSLEDNWYLVIERTYFSGNLHRDIVKFDAFLTYDEAFRYCLHHGIKRSNIIK